MEKIPTAEDFYLKSCYPRTFKSNKQEAIDWLSTDEKGKKSIGIMIEFAKLHVEAALKAASEKAKITERKKVIDNTGGYVRIPTIYKKHILNSYPLDKIKQYEDKDSRLVI